MRRHLILATCASLALTAPAMAQDEEPERGFSLMERGAELFFRGLLNEMDPLLQDLEEFAEGIEPALRDFVAEMGPALRDILAEVEDWSVYEPPEMLENGDIILRRKTPLPPEEPMPEDGEIEI